MRILLKDELSAISGGGLNFLIKAPVFTATLTLTILYLQGYFQKTETLIETVEVSINAANTPSSPLVGWEEFSVIGQQPEKRPSVRG